VVSLLTLNQKCELFRFIDCDKQWAFSIHIIQPMAPGIFHYICRQPSHMLQTLSSWLQPPFLAMILSCHSVHEVKWIRLTFHVVINVAWLLNIRAFTGAFARRVVNRSYKTKLLNLFLFCSYVVSVSAFCIHELGNLYGT